MITNPPAQASDEPMRNKNAQLDDLLFRMDTASSLRSRIEAYNELAALLAPRATADVEQYREGWQDGMQEAQELLSAEIADAARYQWLRNKNPQMLCSIGWSTAGGEFDDPDQVIDAAIAATNPGDPHD